MMNEPKLYMVMLGCRPKNRLTEQHDMFFGIASQLEELKPAMEAFWKEGKHNLHIDVWREVRTVDGFEVKINSAEETEADLFFVNLGGYQQDVFDELHQKLLIAAPDMDSASKKAKKTDFFKHNSLPGAGAHIDEKFAFDVDDLESVKNLLARCGFPGVRISLHRTDAQQSDAINCGYWPLNKMK